MDRTFKHYWWGLSFLWALVAVRGSCGCWALFVGTGVSFVGAESWFVGGGAHSCAAHVCGWGAVVRGRVVCGCWVVVCGCSGAVLCVMW
jgi:hypothetical protein